MVRVIGFRVVQAPILLLAQLVFFFSPFLRGCSEEVICALLLVLVLAAFCGKKLSLVPAACVVVVV